MVPLRTNQAAEPEEPQSEHTLIQPVARRRSVAVDDLEYHLFKPRRTHDPLLERAYEVWREGWKATLLELEGAAEIHSDEFARQDEVGVVSLEGRCLAVTGVRWLDLSLPRSREDSYFKNWPSTAIEQVADRLVCIASNTIVSTAWRGTLLEPPEGRAGEPERLSSTTIALSVRRFVASPAHSLLALTRNDRQIDRLAVVMGATRLAQIAVHGIETDVVCIERSNATPDSPAVRDLWRRRHQA
jgi:hypothetical protein